MMTILVEFAKFYIMFGMISATVWSIGAIVTHLEQSVFDFLWSVIIIVFGWSVMWFVGLWRGLKILSWR